MPKRGGGVRVQIINPEAGHAGYTSLRRARELVERGWGRFEHGRLRLTVPAARPTDCDDDRDVRVSREWKIIQAGRTMPGGPAIPSLQMRTSVRHTRPE